MTAQDQAVLSGEARERLKGLIRLLDTIETTDAADLRSLLDALAAAERRAEEAEADGDLLYWALKHSLGLIVEFGDLNGFRNMSDAELGKAVTGVANEAGAVLNKLDGRAFDPAAIPPRRARALVAAPGGEGEAS